MPIIMPDIVPDYNRYKPITYAYYIVFFVFVMPYILPDKSNLRPVGNNLRCAGSALSLLFIRHS